MNLIPNLPNVVRRAGTTALYVAGMTFVGTTLGVPAVTAFVVSSAAGAVISRNS